MKSVNGQRMYYGVTHPVSLLNVLLDPDNEFERQGVSFKIITEDMFPQVSE